MFYVLTTNRVIHTVMNPLGELSEIDDSTYKTIQNLLANKPTPPDEKHDYRLTVDLEWELFEIPPIPEPDPSVEDKAEAYDILMGVTE